MNISDFSLNQQVEKGILQIEKLLRLFRFISLSTSNRRTFKRVNLNIEVWFTEPWP